MHRMSSSMAQLKSVNEEAQCHKHRDTNRGTIPQNRKILTEAGRLKQVT